MDFILTANLTKLAYMALAFGLVGFAASLFKHVMGLDPVGDINTIQKAARNGQAYPLAVIYLGCFILLSVVVHAVLAG